MSQETVQLARELYGAIEEGEVDQAFAGLDPEIELDLSRRVIDPGTFRGHEALRHFLRQQRDIWSSERVEPEEFIAVGDNVVVVPTRIVSTGRESEIDVSARAAWVWEFRDGLAVRGTMYQSKAEALAAVGPRE